jgi:peptidyl-prolyl cis-trans isomerase A (cyclophilin A)
LILKKIKLFNCSRLRVQLKILLVFMAVSAASCASARLEKLEQRVVPFDESQAELSIPAPVEVDDEFEVTDRVLIKTTMGSMVIGLYGKDAPETVANFLNYVQSGFYTGTVFHRVIPGFMIQGGGFNAQLERAATDSPVELELIPGITHQAGTISMARTSQPDSATSQFFICVANADQLNAEYAAFGKLEEGIDVAIGISQVETHSQESDLATMDDVPVTPVIIESITEIK